MIFNCTNCGKSISSNHERCPFCRSHNLETLELITKQTHKYEPKIWKERIKGSIYSLVTR
jgi:hypothetical protein